MIIKPGHTIDWNDSETIYGKTISQQMIDNSKVYLSLRHNIDCLLCDVHIFNMAFERSKYQGDRTLVIFVLDTEPKDIDAFVEEHPEFPFHIIVDSEKSIFRKLDLPYSERSFLGIKKQIKPFGDFLIDHGTITSIQYGKDEKDHMNYQKIAEFLS